MIITSTYAVLVVGHRGASGYAPENTLLSFEKAIELGVDYIELDVHVCKTGELIVMHDALVDRTTNGTGAIADLTYAEISKLRIAQNQIVPILNQVFDCINRGCKINIELKGPNTALPVANLIKQYVTQKGWQNNDFLISSFDHHELMHFHKLLPKVPTGALFEGLPIACATFAKEAEANYVIVSYEFINKKFVQDAHKCGIKVFVYTVNEPIWIERMKQIKVDGIISNYPDRVHKIRHDIKNSLQ